MKRSEMIELMSDTILDNIELADILEAEQVSILLAEMINAGMMPPAIEFEMGGNTIKDNAWEPEND